ncbi:hybrid sensor histidine kinase/response regulator [Piscinibacter sp.]|uniref:hybrid sensor histidine kinase/response regulator n=1 Tax=Piscinibacter sp. TaxID=1903157 RepID=UPI002B5C88FC|nr:ATP-binding protein [Albitalea sp.]HUG23946.1 ATP-binding protein [Albitalea sp.]
MPDLSESYFQRFAESSEEVLWLADLDSKTLLYVSPRFEQLWGVRADMLLRDPTHWNRAVLASDAKQLPTPFFAEDPDAEETVREYRITSRHGETRWIRDRRFHLREPDGATVQVGGIAEDVTEGKEREMERENLLQREREARTAAEAVVAAKDEFLAVVTHELRSPLNAIRGWAHVLRQSANLTPIQVKALDAIDRNTQAQARLVDDLLDSQRILCGELELTLARVPLAEVIDQAAATVQPAAQAKRIRLEVAHDETIGLVQVDTTRLRQAFVKLLSNAVKFTPEDGIVTLRSGVREHALAVEVRDTGIGLEPAQLPFVFDRFQQADSSSTRRANGLGLGLSLAQQLVELHGGRIVVESEGVGLGARFTVELPLHLLLPNGADGEATRTAGSSLAGKRVVIVEDDNDGREVLGIILRGAKMELQSFDRAASAYEYLAQAPADQQPDAMISDIAMPDEDGYAFIRRVREMEDHRHRPHLVALALTSFTRAEDRLCALKAGFDAHVPKPIDPETVLRSLERALGLSKEAGLPA